MSTSATIACLNKETNSINVTYCVSDGYPSFTGLYLLTYYDRYDKVIELCSSDPFIHVVNHTDLPLLTPRREVDGCPVTCESMESYLDMIGAAGRDYHYFFDIALNEWYIIGTERRWPDGYDWQKANRVPLYEILGTNF